jgi:hypothetical protein
MAPAGGDGPPKTLSQKTARKWLISLGWVEEKGGKHVVKMTKPGCRPLTLPMNKGADYPKGLRAAIVREAANAKIGGGGDG